MKKKAVIVSRYVNPIHKGHLEYFNNAKEIADELFVIVNCDHQTALIINKSFKARESGWSSFRKSSL
jgi:cytidyltransferase-like protein